MIHGPANLSLAWDRWITAVPDINRAAEFAAQAAKILFNKQTYVLAGSSLDIPWYVIGVLHMRESNFNFKTFLANGDPLPGPTAHVPKGLGPCPTWQAGAYASLIHEGWGKGMEWDIANALLHIEAYNGMGYANQGIPSPYVWAGTSIYSKGKYSSDGHYDPNMVDTQPGAAPVLMALKANGVNLNEATHP